MYAVWIVGLVVVHWLVGNSASQHRHCNGYKFEQAYESKAVCVSIIHGVVVVLVCFLALGDRACGAQSKWLT